MSVRESFVAQFGEENALALEAAAREHENGMHPNQGADPFKWTLMLVLSFQCAELPHYQEHHGISLDWPSFQQWIKDHGELASYDGDVDVLALVCEVYTEYMPETSDAK
jgi:hypothetical protein